MILKGLKRAYRKTPVNLFFLELIIVLLFFSISGAVILKMFATADILEEKNSLSGKAIADAQSVAELYAVTGDMRGAMVKIFGEGWYTEGADGGITICLDEARLPLLTEDVRDRYGRVKLILTETRESGKCGEMCRLRTRVFLLSDGGKEIYTQESSAYIPDFAAGGAV